MLKGYIYAWPMVLITYMLVRKDLTTVIPDPRAQSFLVEFLKSMYDPLYTERCEKEYLNFAVKGKLLEIALQSIETIVLSPEAPQWIRETSVISGDGQGEFVISVRREQSSLIQQDILTSKINAAEITLQEVIVQLESMESNTLKMKDQFEQIVSTQMNSDASILADKSTRIDASFIMAIISLVLWFITAVAYCHQRAKLRELESRPRIIAPEQPAKKKRLRDADGV